MARPRRRPVLAAAGAVVVIALVLAGCGRRQGGIAAGDDPAGLAGQVAPSTTVAATLEPALASPPRRPTGPPAEATAAATAHPASIAPPVPAATPEPAPLVPPDLSTIDGLLAELDAALGADATADTEEGSAP